MKLKCGILILMFVFPVRTFAHAEIFFPKLLSPAELPHTGIVLLNPDPTIASVNVHMFTANGAPSPAVQFQIAPKGQLAKLGSELFPDASTPGWIYVLTDTEGMQAFWLNYNGEITFLDGAEAAQYDTLGTDQIIPLVVPQTELNVINPNFLVVPLRIRLFGNDGPLGPEFSVELPRAGAFQAQTSMLFPGVDMAQARYLRVRSGGAAIASSAVVRGLLVPAESAVVNGINVATRMDATFPHVINGTLVDANYTTVIGVTNLSNSSQSVTLTFYPDGGNAFAVSRTLAGNGALRETAQSLFGLTAEFQGGWVRLTGTAPLTGFAAYADSVAGGLTVVSAGLLQTNLFFSHIADGPPQWQTGIAGSGLI